MNRMNNLRIAPEGQGKYKNMNPLNETITDDDEEAWSVNLEKVRKTTPMGNNNPKSGWKDLSWANKPKPNKAKMDGGSSHSRRRRVNKKRSNRSKTRKA